MAPSLILDECKELRKEAKALAAKVLEFKTRIAAGRDAVSVKTDVGEMVANSMLTYRHLEDAGMRLGKVIQAYDGGVSVYDK